MKNKKKIYIIVLVLIIILLVIYHIYIIHKNKTEENKIQYNSLGDKYSTTKVINSTTLGEILEIQFTKTYKILSTLNKENSSEAYNYYVVEEFQKDNPTVVKIAKEYTELEIDKNYEFTFKGYKRYTDKDYTIKDIFEEFKIVSINETNKERNRTNTRGSLI